MYDGRGSVVQEVNYNNSWYTLKGRIGKAQVTSYSYSAFGELLQNESSGFWFNGEAYDSATGMLNLRARQFEPAIGRFEQRDRWAGYATFALSQNRYTYCVNDPINLADRGGDRYDEGGVSVASNVSKGMSVSAAVAKSAASQAKVTSIYNANVKPKTSNPSGYVSVADLIIDYYKDKRVPEIVVIETPAQEQARAEREEALDLFAEKGFAFETLNSDQRDIVNNALKKVYDTALNGVFNNGDWLAAIVDEACKTIQAQRDIIDTAKNYIGRPYPRVDYPDPSATDCSDLVSKILHDVFNIEVKDKADTQWKFAQESSSFNYYDISNPNDYKSWGIRPGDIIFYQCPNCTCGGEKCDRRYNGQIHHVAIYAGNGEVIDSTLTETVDGVTQRDLYAIQPDTSHGEYVPIGFARISDQPTSIG